MHTRTSEPKTPLITLLRSLTPDQRTQLADEAGTSVSYLYALGGCDRKQCKADLAARIERATKDMRVRTRYQTIVITVEELGTMCQGCEAL